MQCLNTIGRRGHSVYSGCSMWSCCRPHATLHVGRMSAVRCVCYHDRSAQCRLLDPSCMQCNATPHVACRSELACVQRSRARRMRQCAHCMRLAQCNAGNQRTPKKIPRMPCLLPRPAGDLRRWMERRFAAAHATRRSERRGGGAEAERAQYGAAQHEPPRVAQQCCAQWQRKSIIRRSLYIGTAAGRQPWAAVQKPGLGQSRRR
jgi:hypothetical protein